MARTLNIPTRFTAKDGFSSPVSRMADSVKTFAAKTEVFVARADRSFRRLSSGVLSETGRQFLQLASTAALAGGVVSGVMFSAKSLQEYETSIQSFRTIVSDLTDNEFVVFKKEISNIASETKKSSIDVAKSFEKIAGLNASFAATAGGLGAVSKASIMLAKASGMELGDSAENLVGIMNQFGFGALEADRAINVLAAGQAVGAANIAQTAEAFKNFGATAKASNITMEESVGLIQTLAQKSILGAEAGTKLRGAVSKLQEANVGYASGQFNVNDALAEAKAKIDGLGSAKEKDAAISKMFGLENKTAGLILLDSIQTYKDFTAGVTGTSEAQKAAEINSSTLAVKLEELSASWVNLLTSTESVGAGMNMLKSVISFVSNNLEAIVTVVGIFIGYFALMKAAILLSQGALMAYNAVASAVFLVDMIKYIASTQGLTFAQAALAVAQSSVNAAMLANPIGIMVAAIAALIALVVVVVAKWNTWGAALAVFLGPLGLVISLIQSFRSNWDLIKQAFREGGIVEGLKMIGKTILDSILMPLQQLLEIMSKLPVVGKFAAQGAEKIAAMRAGMGVNTEEIGATSEVAQVASSKKAQTDRISESVTTQRQNVNIDINDKTGSASVKSDNDLVPVNVTSTWK